MKRRVLALILCLLLLYSCCPAAAASGIMQIKLGTVTAKAGETVDVPVELIDNSGVAGLQIKVVFGDELTLTGVDYTADGVTHLTSQPSAKLTSPVKLTWYNGTANSTYNGVVAVLHFTVAQECTASEIPLTLSINDYDVADVTESNVPFTAVNGAVKLEKKCSHETELKNAVDATCTAAGYSGDAVCKICGETVEVGRATPALGHDYCSPTYAWSADYSACTATRICNRNAAHSETANGTVSSSVTTQPTVDAAGVRTYVAQFKENWAVSQTVTEEIPTLPKMYTVSYDANGGTGAPAAQTKTHGTTLTLSSTKPMRTGYTFLGWASSKTATSAQYQPGGSYTANAEVTLYAVWEANAPTPTGDPSIIASGICGENLTWTLSKDGVLTVSGTGTMQRFSSTVEVPWNDYRENIITVIIEGGCTSIGRYAFDSCLNLTDVKIPGSITNIEENAFWNCKQLASVYINDLAAWCGIQQYGWGAGPLTNEASLYFNSQLVTDLVIPDNIQTISASAFSGCISLKTVTIPRGITSIGLRAFAECGNLTSVEMADTLEKIGMQAFYNCAKLKNVTIPEGVTSIGKQAFSCCAALISVTVPDSVTSIGESAFADCSSLKRVSIPNGVQTIEAHTFAGCSILTEITIPESVTSIGDYAFCNCSSLANIILPCSITRIGRIAFSGCNKLTNVYYMGSEEEWNDVSILAENDPLKNATIHFNASTPTPTPSPNPTPTPIPAPTPHSHTWDNGVVTTPAKPGKEGVMTYTCTVCKETRTETIPALPVTYMVSYDANGGTGAPAVQTKTHGTALTLSSTKPTRTGYTFLGWAASKTATSAQYQPGGSYTANAAVTLCAVWKENAPTYATTLTVSSATASQGKEVSLNVSLAGNPGIIGINFQITYDKTRLKLIGYADGAMKDWSVGIGESEKAIWIDEAADVINGNILTLKFQVLDNAPDGLAEVTVTGFKAAALDESAVNANIVAGGVTVTSQIPGDVNDDGEVDIFDCVRLKKYIAGFDVTISEANADVNGDGEIDIFDCVRLKKYLAGFNVELK